MLTHELRAAGIAAGRAYDSRSMKAQMRAADRSGAAVVVIIGPEERDAGTVVVRPLRGGGEQTVIPRDPAPRSRAEGVVVTGSATSLRTHLCGELRPAHVGETVTLCGWVARRREHGEHLAFVDVRDHAGVVQCVVDNDVDVRSEYVVRITGIVRGRPEGTVNPNLATGEIEVGDCQVEVLRSATPPPFPIDARADDVDEVVRLQYRYLDIRRERMQRNLRIRSAVNSAIRSSMEAQGFVEVETPMLVPSTPEGAPRLPRPVAQGAGVVLRPAPVAPALQAAAHGGGHRPLLPDRPVPP